MSSSAQRTVLWTGPRVAALAVLALTSCLLWAGQSKATTAPGVVPPVPHQLGLWHGTPLEATDRVLEILETDAVSLMEYRLGKQPPVWFAQVAGFGNRAAFHPPELCYVGSHYEILERGPITVTVNGTSRRLMRLVLSQDRQRFEAWYWFTANGRVTPNYYQQQLWLLYDMIQRHPGSGTLVRISSPMTDPADTHRRLLAFLTSWESVSNTPSRHGS